MKFRLWLLTFLAFLSPLAAEDPQVDATIGVEMRFAEHSGPRELITASAATEPFTIAAALSVNSDAKYGPEVAYLRTSDSFFDQYFLMEEGYAQVRLGDLWFTGGRFRQAEEYRSPYSLFLNGEDLPSLGMLLRWKAGFFTYESRWIELNSRSHFRTAAETPEAWRDRGGFPDRGANLKTFIFQAGTMRLGLQDAGVYTNRNFDMEYFLSPMPQYFTQYVKATPGRPWTTGANENNILGLFWDWAEPEFNLGFQFLVDDFSLNFLGNDVFPNNPWKAAWTLGGEWRTEEGIWGLFHAGALKYTFQPITTVPGDESGSAYGYTRYPDVEYWAGSGWRALEIGDNALGYRHGENNAAWMLTFRREGKDWEASGRAEFLVAGSNSPANPWQDGSGSNQSELGTHWLDDAVLQKSLVLEAGLSWRVPDWTFTVRARLGRIWNVLELSDPVLGSAPGTLSTLDRDIKIYRPSSRDQAVAELALGATWHWDLTAMLK